jgi:hypothetical protein
LVEVATNAHEDAKTPGPRHELIRVPASFSTVKQAAIIDLALKQRRLNVQPPTTRFFLQYLVELTTTGRFFNYREWNICYVRSQS